VIAIIAACISTAGVIISSVILIKANQIHVLVNSRLDTAVKEIEDLKTQRDLKRDDDSGQR
jgi:hypothetical protein